MTKPKGISSRRRRRRKEEEGEVNLNVQEEDVDDYGDVGNLLFLRAMILQKGAINTIDTGWLLLDNQSIDDIFSNTWIAKDICNSWRRYIVIHCNSSKRRIMREENIKVYGTVWYDKMAITNILYFRNIREKYPVRYDTKGNLFVVVEMDREILFRQSAAGLYFHYIYNCNIFLINTVKDTLEDFTQ